LAWSGRLDRQGCGTGSGAPGTVAVVDFTQGGMGDGYVFVDLEIEHTGADEVGAVLVGVAESLTAMDGTACITWFGLSALSV
jgi:hypothetical protein